MEEQQQNQPTLEETVQKIESAIKELEIKKNKILNVFLIFYSFFKEYF